MLRILPILLTLLAGSALAQDPDTGAWSSQCDGPHCVFQKTLTLDDGAAFAVLEILIELETGTASIIGTAPLGVALESGLTLVAGSAEWSLPFKLCQADGCRAALELDSTEFAALLQQTELSIAYMPFGADKAVAGDLQLERLVTAISRARP